jgi:DNA-binding IclR family transcriptional regulator
MNNGPQSVERALQILRSFESEEQALSIGEIATLLQVHKSTASRLTATLHRAGLLDRTHPDGRFRLGPELARLGLLALAGRDLMQVAREPMTDAAAASGETVTLAVLDGRELTTIAQIDSAHVVGPRSWLGRRAPLHACSDGKVFLAFGGAALPDGPLVALTSRTVTRRAALRRELAEVRARGWAHAIGELEDGLHGVAAPVRDAAGDCRAALSISGPAYRLAAESLPFVATACVEAATRIGSQLAATADGAVPIGGGRPAH